MPAPRRVTVLSTGGTIASQSRPGGAVPVLDGADLLSDDLLPPGLSSDDVVTRTVCAVDSSAMTDVEHRLLLAAVRAALVDPDVAGVVITHGTDTLEESAMLLDLTHDDPRPVVITGAQYPADSPHSDGPGNVAAALACAVDHDSRGRGVLIALGGRVLPARGSFKTSTTAITGFDTVHPGLARPVLSVDDRPTARVDIVALYPGIDPGVIDALVGSGARGLVLSALGSGNTHPAVVTAVAAAIADGVAVVVASRVPHGAVVPTYGGGGGAVDLTAVGAIISTWLRPPQARIALSALLTRDASAAEVATFLAATDPVS